MLRTDLPDHRRASEEDLVAALQRRDPLALAEAYHRTIPSAHAVARRLLSASAEVEALLREVYSQLWSSPPGGVSLEGWVRARCFAAAADDLRERDAAPASPSLTAVLPELPRPEGRYLDAAERALADLADEQRRALLLAHDKGVSTEEQNVPNASMSLVEALLALAGPEPGSDVPDPSACANVPLLGDWVLGLLPPGRAAAVAQEVAARPECTMLAKALRRGRRRLEGLPPTPDMGQRVLVVVLAGAPAPVASPAPVSTPGHHDGDHTQPMTSALDTAIPGSAPPPPGLGVVNDVDTGEIVVSDGPGAGGHREAPGETIYSELAELDTAGDQEQPLGLAGEAEETTGDDFTVPRRSVGGRLLLWLLAAVFLVAGVAAGLYLGLTLFS